MYTRLSLSLCFSRLSPVRLGGQRGAVVREKDENPQGPRAHKGVGNVKQAVEKQRRPVATQCILQCPAAIWRRSQKEKEKEKIKMGRQESKCKLLSREASEHPLDRHTHTHTRTHARTYTHTHTPPVLICCMSRVWIRSSTVRTRPVRGHAKQKRMRPSSSGREQSR